MKPLIYAVEDDPALQELYSLSLENEFECVCLESGAHLSEALKTRIPGLILLDIMLPGDDGFTILGNLKSDKATAQIPVIIISAKGEELSKVKGLNLGADDYIAKPFGVLELIARIKANLRKRPAAVTGTAAFKDIVIDNAKHTITVNGTKLEVALKEYNLLAFLCENAENVLTREEIFNRVWGADYIGESRTLDIHIKELRKKLASAGSEAGIKTVRAVGYMIQ